MIKISAVICTFKRADYLRLALRSLCDQTLASGEYEVIVVDNAADKETAAVFHEYGDGRANFRYVVENRVGLSHARNKGMKCAAGKYIAFMDDDARADDHWLETLMSAFEGLSPRPAAIGGRVWLDWHGERPRWVPDRHLSLYSSVDHGDKGHLLEETEYLVGANLAFNKQALYDAGGFDPNLGRQGSVLLSGEEGKVLQELRNRHLGVYYEPGAVVWHSVPPSRQRPGWLLKRMFWDGASQPLVNRPETGFSRRSLLSNAYTDLRQCVKWCGSTLGAVLSGKRSRAWESLLGLCQRAGRLRTQIRLLAWNHD